MSAADLLRQSRAAHARFYQHYQVWNPTEKQWGHGSLSDALEALKVARRTRMEAEKADSTHTDLAWRDDTVPSSELLGFYDGVLTFYGVVDVVPATPVDPSPPIETTPPEPPVLAVGDLVTIGTDAYRVVEDINEKGIVAYRLEPELANPDVLPAESVIAHV